MKILAVDDEPYVLDLIEVILKMDGHELTLARNGREGLQMFKAGMFDIVITDLNMPEVSGVEMAKSIKDIDPKVKILLMSGDGEQDCGHPAGIDLVLSKPLRINSLKDVLAKLAP